jgi:Zn-dependent protease
MPNRYTSMRIGALDGVPVWLHWSFLLGAIGTLCLNSFAFFGALGAVVGFTLLVLAHELGHAAFVRAFGERALAITFYLWGGECSHTNARLSKLQLSIIAWGGVLAQLVLLAVTKYVVGARVLFDNAFLSAFVWVLLVPNVVMMAFNLLPVRRLDGYLAWQLPYHAFRAWWTKGEAKRMIERATRGATPLRVIRGGKK